MIKVIIELPDNRKVVAQIKERGYKKLIADYTKLSFFAKLKLLLTQGRI